MDHFKSPVSSGMYSAVLARSWCYHYKQLFIDVTEIENLHEHCERTSESRTAQDTARPLSVTFLTAFFARGKISWTLGKEFPIIREPLVIRRKISETGTSLKYVSSFNSHSIHAGDVCMLILYRTQP